MKSHSHDDGNQAFDKLVEGIRPLASVIMELRAKMKAADLFPNDRELLDCPKCKLEQDVTIEGVIITYRLTTVRIGGAVLPTERSFAAKAFRNELKSDF